ncbi:MAG: phosphoribosylamine--glycine ligase [Pleurocapsa sp. SU_196_0]|nr:phosphoribosylamine--glycine ligase [Pleurocapsa sp. SU_196_0]
MAGLADDLDRAGIKTFGPKAAAARLEASKSFAKYAMREFGVPTAAFGVFDALEPAMNFVRSQPFSSAGFVVKADGLAAGKGVLVCDSLEETQAALEACFGGAFSSAGSRVVIEERLSGQELSVLAFCDGETVVPMLPARDHKRALDNDEGLNTGGMGAFSPAPDIGAAFLEQIKHTVLEPMVRGMASRGTPYKGVLYAGLMLTDAGVRVIEFNCRFGDPEAQVVLPLLETPLTDILNACVDGALDLVEPRWTLDSCAPSSSPAVDTPRLIKTDT